MLSQAGIISEAYIKYRNIVFSANLDRKLNLNKVAFGLENLEYEPDRSPVLVYRLFVPKVVILIFSTGKIVITGCKEYRDTERSCRNTCQGSGSTGYFIRM